MWPTLGKQLGLGRRCQGCGGQHPSFQPSLGLGRGSTGLHPLGHGVDFYFPAQDGGVRGEQGSAVYPRGRGPRDGPRAHYPHSGAWRRDCRGSPCPGPLPRGRPSRRTAPASTKSPPGARPIPDSARPGEAEAAVAAIDVRGRAHDPAGTNRVRQPPAISPAAGAAPARSTHSRTDADTRTAQRARARPRHARARRPRRRPRPRRTRSSLRPAIACRPRRSRQPVRAGMRPSS